MKLIPMTDFVIKESGKCGIEPRLRRCENYALFLKRHLALEMFVPCDYNGDVIMDPCQNNRYCIDYCQGSCQEEYNKGKEGVLFEGFELIHADEFLIVVRKGNKVTKSCTVIFETRNEFRPTIESLDKDDLELTESAIKLIGL